MAGTWRRNYGRRFAATFFLLLQVSLIAHCIVVEEEPSFSSPKVPSTPSFSPPEEGEEGAGVGGRGRGGGGGGGGSSGGAYTQPMYNSLGVEDRNVEDECELTVLNIDEKEYEKRCGASSDSKWPCFTHWAGDLSQVNIIPWLEPMDPTRDILVRNKEGLEFTLRNATDTFSIHYTDYYNLHLRYYGYDPATGCFNIHLSNTGPLNDYGRRWVSDDDDRDPRDIDTFHYLETGKRLCGKWIHIHLSQETPLPWRHRSDHSGV